MTNTFILFRLLEIEKEIIQEHNKFRAKHGVPPLKPSLILRTAAQEWADLCMESNILSRRPNTYFGENGRRLTSVNRSFSPAKIVKAWYAGAKTYNYNSTKLNSKSRPFAQVIWKSSVEIGVGYAQKKS